MGSARQPEDEKAHDILAAEAFAVPAPDPGLHHVKPPEDPSGISEAHDILAAEEFAMPAPSQSTRSSAPARHSRSKLTAVAAGGAGLVGALLLRIRRRG